MEVIRGGHNINSTHKVCVATIGNFDGLHRGHKELLQQLVKKSTELNIPSLVITFEPHPQEFFSKKLKLPRLTRLREKIFLFSKTGVDRLLCLPFKEKIASLPAESVIHDFLVKTLDVKYVLVGDDFRFGKNRRGDYTMLKAAGKKFNFAVSHLDTQVFNGTRISSTAVREALGKGNFTLAEALLGHTYFIIGKVIYGRSLGRQIGVPTANISLRNYNSVLKGTYIVAVDGVTDKKLPGVANIGVRPTVDGENMLLEVHLLDYNNDFYGNLLSVQFLHKIRDEIKFPDIQALQQRISKDIEIARQWFVKIHKDDIS